MPYRITHIGDDASALRVGAATRDTEGVSFVDPEDPSFAPDVVVLGPGAKDPLREAQRLKAAAPAAQIVFLVPPDRLDRFQKSLPFVPHMASAWTAATDVPLEQLSEVLGRAAEIALKRATLDRVKAGINSNLEAGARLTRRTEAEDRRQRQLILSEGYLATLLAQAPDVFIALTIEGDISAWNDAAGRFFGASAAQVMGRAARDVLESNVFAEIEPLIVSGEDGVRIERHEMSIDTHKGVRWVEVNSAPVNNPDKSVAFISLTLRDVTDRVMTELRLRDSEARYRTLSETLPQLVWTCRSDGYCEYLSRQWVEYTGLPESEQLGDQWIERVVHPSDRERTAEHWLGAVAGRHLYDIEYRIRGGDGAYRWFKTRGIPVRDEAGSIIHWFGTCTEIEDIVRARQSLARDAESLAAQVEEEVLRRRDAEDALRQAQKMEAVGQLTGGIAHDFNNMLTGVIGSLDIMRRRMAAGRIDDLDRFMDAASTSAERAASLTQRLLAFSRRQSLDSKPLAVNSSIASLSDLLRRTVAEQIEVKLSLDPSDPIAVVDANQLESAILNLSINAGQAMPEGGQLDITTRVETLLGPEASRLALTPGSYVAVTVADTGVGMEASVVERAFEPFFTTKPIGQGTGLGLSMVYGFVTQSGGQIEIDSALGLGTRITLYLPSGAVDETLIAEGEDLVAPDGAGQQVLVVEDEAAVRQLISGILIDLGYRTLVAEDPQAAIRFLTGPSAIDLMVSDVGLPGMNGRQLAEVARGHRPGLPVLFVTGYAENAALRADFLGTDMAMITKPFAYETLALKVGAMLASRQTSTPEPARSEQPL